MFILLAEALKKEGNLLFVGKDFEAAVAKYTEALKYAPTNKFILGNRSAALLKLGKPTEALIDAELASEHSPQWAKVKPVCGTLSSRNLAGLLSPIRGLAGAEAAP